MKSSSFVNRSLIMLLLTCITVGLCAQEQTQNAEFVPHVGQAGKDVIWVPTPDDLVNKMLEIAEVTAKDFVIDLGSGDGRTVIAAAKLGARAFGIEYNPEMVELSKKNAVEAGVSGKTKFIQADLFECDLSEATVITMFLLPEINLKLRPRLLDLKPGTRIVSNTFTMEDWEPDFEVTTEENWNSWYTALMWIVPAKVEGNWKLGGGELTIRQEFQMLYGTFKSDNKTSTINAGRLNGNVITFSIDGETYTGNVNGKTTIAGTVTTGSSKKDWIATFTGSGD
ncbi:MAG: class I SAM-dependent methyltransferase [Bacteroidales bacterium]|nr:class I SAM-dependent methyltransferase [Bacteroidales bacterium]